MSKRSHKRPNRRRRRRAAAQAQRSRRIRIAGFALLALAAVAALILWRNATAPQLSEALAETPPNLLGPADAPVTIVEYGDFGCHACRAWHNSGVKEQLLADFGDQINFEFRHFPVITRQSPQAAEAAQCAAAQDSFWEYHDYIYESTPQGALSRQNLVDYAGAIGLDSETFAACLDSGKYEPLIEAHHQQALDAGARGTPTFVLNGRQISFSYQGMAAAIEEALR